MGTSRALASTLAVLLALGALGGDADAKKKKKKLKNPGATVTAVAAAANSTNPTATATCTGKTHATGGGFSVAPSFTPPASGVRSLTSTSIPSGNQAWVAAGDVYATPLSSGVFTTYARCEKNAAGRIAIRGSSTMTLLPAAGQNMVFNCPPNTHVISGGYSAQALGSFTFASTSHRIVVLQSRRTGIGQWTISAFNNPASPTPADLTGYAVCEVNAKGSAVTEAASPLTPLVDDGRTVADATCVGKKHSVSGGFLVSPATFPGAVPLVAIDENQPVGKPAWHIGLSEYPTELPPGSTLQSFVYCKKG